MEEALVGQRSNEVNCLDLNEDPPTTGESPAETERSQPASLAPRSVLTIYESFVTACAAKAALREMEEISRLTNWTDNMWKFDMLRLPVFRSIAAAEAATADWVAVSFEHNTSFPVELRDWLELWRQKGATSAQTLIAICVPPRITEIQGGVLRDLWIFSQSAGCKFRGLIGKADPNPGSEMDWSMTATFTNWYNPDAHQ